METEHTRFEIDIYWPPSGTEHYTSYDGYEYLCMEREMYIGKIRNELDWCQIQRNNHVRADVLPPFFPKGDLAVTIDAFPRHRASTNLLSLAKLPFDALQHILFANDNQVMRLLLRLQPLQPDVQGILHVQVLQEECKTGNGMERTGVENAQENVARFDMPCGPSVNEHFFLDKGMMRCSREASRFFRHVRQSRDCTDVTDRPRFASGPVSVKLDAYMPAETKRDLDNVLKLPLLALTGIAYKSSNQIVELFATKHRSDRNSIRIQVESASERVSAIPAAKMPLLLRPSESCRQAHRSTAADCDYGASPTFWEIQLARSRRYRSLLFPTEPRILSDSFSYQRNRQAIKRKCPMAELGRPSTLLEAALHQELK